MKAEEMTHMRCGKAQLVRLRKLKIHSNQADYEILEQLLNIKELYPSNPKLNAAIERGMTLD